MGTHDLYRAPTLRDTTPPNLLGKLPEDEMYFQGKFFFGA
jgi:hypothetical protein